MVSCHTEKKIYLSQLLTCLSVQFHLVKLLFAHSSLNIPCLSCFRVFAFVLPSPWTDYSFSSFLWSLEDFILGPQNFFSLILECFPSDSYMFASSLYSCLSPLMSFSKRKISCLKEPCPPKPSLSCPLHVVFILALNFT